MSVLFIAHGAPLIALEDDTYTRTLEQLGQKIPKPNAIIVVSAHWEETAPIRVTASPHPPLIYDFGGFPDEMYELKYPAPGEPALAKEMTGLLSQAGLKAELEVKRGWDHGVWTPLKRIFPLAQVPVVEVSLPVPRKPETVFQMGTALAPLTRKNILLMGSGGIVHNLRRIKMSTKEAPVDDWAEEFDHWVAQQISQKNIVALQNYKSHPLAAQAVQGPEHFEPLLFALGAADGKNLVPIFEGFQYGNLSLRSYGTKIN